MSWTSDFNRFMPSMLNHSDNIIAMVEACRPRLVDAAQTIIDNWDWEWGGCCDAIAQEIVMKLDELEGLGGQEFSEEGEQHCSVVIPAIEGIVTVDIPWRIYEHRLGWCRYAPTGNRLDPSDLVVDFVDVSPEQAGLAS